MTNLTSLKMGLEANGVQSLIDCETAKFYAHLFGLAAHSFRNSHELAQELLKANENGAEWNRFSITCALPRTDQNLIHKILYGIRLH